MNRVRCIDCHNTHAENTLLTAPNPFDPTEIVTGCPTCKSIGGLVSVCDEPSCNKEVSCGWNSPAGYRHTCYEHSCWVKK